jgi:L-iditol 2-dehydrogenase
MRDRYQVVFHGARTKMPIILGHEFAGDIADASPNLKDYIGKRVVVDPDIFDGNCEYCLRGITPYVQTFTP